MQTPDPTAPEIFSYKVSSFGLKAKNLLIKKFKIITKTVIIHLLIIVGIGKNLNNNAQPTYSNAIVNNLPKMNLQNSTTFSPNSSAFE